MKRVWDASSDLGKIVAMMQFNMITFTVDEHLIRAVGILKRSNAAPEDDHPLSTHIFPTLQAAARSTAVLLHDVWMVGRSSIAGEKVALALSAPGHDAR
jgi:UTP:GlnB (protein PII) uridylyltransferase